jgi:trehalose/maltose hydrolase-like predicted phosphorylase
MNEETKEMLIAQAKFTLKQAGYFVDNLWHIDDVKLRYNCEDNEQAQDILNNALTNDATMHQIWFALDMAAQDEGLTLKD